MESAGKAFKREGTIDTVWEKTSEARTHDLDEHDIMYTFCIGIYYGSPIAAKLRQFIPFEKTL